MGLTDGVAAQIKVRELQDEIERLRAAVHSTASQGTFNERAIRKVVSFELAELIMEERTNQQTAEKL